MIGDFSHQIKLSKDKLRKKSKNYKKNFHKIKTFIENDTIKIIIRNKCSPRHVPDEIFNIPEIPYTISGKKIETPIKRILMGAEVDKVISKDSLRNPTAIDYFKKFKSLF